MNIVTFLCDKSINHLFFYPVHNVEIQIVGMLNDILKNSWLHFICDAEMYTPNLDISHLLGISNFLGTVTKQWLDSDSVVTIVNYQQLS